MPSLTVDILRRLVAFDTTNPPRRITADGIFSYVCDLLANAGFELHLFDLGDGCLNLLALRGEPHVLFNVHLDTVPADESWSGDPFDLQIADDRVIGLGACDIKGAAACLLAAATTTGGSVALLLTSDEEAGQSLCVKSFLEDVPAGIDAVVVAEPTRCRAVAAHRGLHTAEGIFRGHAGHGSAGNGCMRSAIHDATGWVQAALAHAAMRESDTYDTLSGLRLNVGVIEGGTKANVIASSARVVFGMRPLPDQASQSVFEDLCHLAPDAEWTTRFQAPSLSLSAASQGLIESLGIEPGPAVDFWTEAALFAEAGLPSIVFGPGDIAQAHTAGEWVALDQLERATEIYTRLFTA